MQFLPIVVVAAVGLAIFRRPNKKKPSQKALSEKPPQKHLSATQLGEMFLGEELPDLIEASVGETFTIKFSPAGSGEYTLLSATPIDESIAKLNSSGQEDKDPKRPTIHRESGDELWTFRAKKRGVGSIVFHLKQNGNPQPLEIDEINVKIN